MKLFLIILVLSSCVAPRFTPDHQQQVRYVRATGDTLVFVERKGDSVYMLDNTTRRNKMRAGDRYTIQHDTTQFVTKDGRKYFRAILRRNL